MTTSVEFNTDRTAKGFKDYHAFAVTLNTLYFKKLISI